MSELERILALLDEDEGRLFNSLNQFNKSQKNNIFNNEEISELGGHIAPGAKESLPDYFPTAEDIEASFDKNVLEVIRNA